jgi:hypothetical protein
MSLSQSGISNLAHLTMTDVNLAVQLGLIGLIFLSVYYKKQGKIKLHGNLIFSAVIVNIGLIFIHMLPSLQGDVGREIINDPLGAVPLLGVSHSALGIVTIVLAGWLVGGWASGWSMRPFCYGKGRIMRVIYWLWIATLLVGVVLYIFHWYVYPN